jgi:hypothetical protein
MHFYGVQNAHFCEVPFSYALIFLNAFPSNFDMTVLGVIFFYFIVYWASVSILVNSSVMIFQLNLIAVKLVQKEAHVNIVQICVCIFD